ncbi:hypothetical protein FRC04_000811 [Tulasnella sp. 424]|nr:hypothetical protein FRC04_000811 [Tulasnella sp. 424]
MATNTESCAECVKRGRECNSIFPECEFYRRAAPSQRGGIRQARQQQEQEYLIQYAQGLERKLAQLKSANQPSSSASRRTSGSEGTTSRGTLLGLEGKQWWLESPLPALTHGVLVQAFNNAAERHHLHFCKSIMQDVLSGSSSSREPHPALINSVYLLAVASASQIPKLAPYSSAQAESHFLAQAREGMTDSISRVNRLVDYLKASAIVSIYLIKKGRHLEGYYHYSSAAGTAIACGLHSNPFVSGNPGSQNVVLLPTSDPLEAIDRIYTFWTFYYQDKVYAIIFGFASAFNEEVDASVVDLMSLMDNLAGYLPPAALGELFAEPGAVNGVVFSHSVFIRQIQAIGLLHQVRKMCAAKRFAPGELAHIRMQAENMLESYAPNPNAQGGRAFCTRTILLSTLVEVARVSATPDWGAEARPSMAIAESIEGLKEQELRMSCVMAQYCWKFAAAILMEHREHLQLQKDNEAEVSKVGSCIDRLESAVTWAGSSSA